MSGAYGMNAAERRRWREESSPTGNHAYARQKALEHEELAQALNAKHRWHVYCSQWASCGWSGYRMARTRREACAKPCPRCQRVHNRESQVTA